MSLELIALDKHWAHEIEMDGNASLEASCSNFESIAPVLEEVVDAHLALYNKTGACAPWIAYFARMTSSREIVGVCSLTDKSTSGRVEISYFTFAPYQGHGVGRVMAEKLVDLAFKHPDVNEVIAHTLPRESASTRILRGLDFVHAGSATDPNDGEVWVWSLTRARSGRHTLARFKIGALLTMLA